MDNYEKYVKYKLKYIELKEKLAYNDNNNTDLSNEEQNSIDLNFQDGGYTRFKCVPNNDFSKICTEFSDGQYKSKERAN